MKTLFKMVAGMVAALAVLPNSAGAFGPKPALYTAAQAREGANVYQQSCAACHGTSLEGGAAPALKGQAFGEMASAQSLTVDTLMSVIANTMPQSDPGSLAPLQVNTVVAYILQQNDYPAGAGLLTPDTAAQAHVRLAAGDTREVENTKPDTRKDKADVIKKPGPTSAGAKTKPRHHKAKHPL
jgi:mono/diheme cytochrome c family protein